MCTERSYVHTSMIIYYMKISPLSVNIYTTAPVYIYCLAKATVFFRLVVHGFFGNRRWLRVQHTKPSTLGWSV